MFKYLNIALILFLFFISFIDSEAKVPRTKAKHKAGKLLVPKIKQSDTNIDFLNYTHSDKSKKDVNFDKIEYSSLSKTVDVDTNTFKLNIKLLNNKQYISDADFAKIFDGKLLSNKNFSIIATSKGIFTFIRSSTICKFVEENKQYLIQLNLPVITINDELNIPFEAIFISLDSMMLYRVTKTQTGFALYKDYKYRNNGYISYSYNELVNSINPTDVNLQNTQTKIDGIDSNSYINQDTSKNKKLIQETLKKLETKKMHNQSDSANIVSTNTFPTNNDTTNPINNTTAPALANNNQNLISKDSLDYQVEKLTRTVDSLREKINKLLQDQNQKTNIKPNYLNGDNTGTNNLDGDGYKIPKSLKRKNIDKYLTKKNDK